MDRVRKCTCPHCANEWNVPLSALGQELICPRCWQTSDSEWLRADLPQRRRFFVGWWEKIFSHKQD